MTNNKGNKNVKTRKKKKIQCNESSKPLGRAHRLSLFFQGWCDVSRPPASTSPIFIFI